MDTIERIVKDFNPLHNDGADKALYSHKDEILIRILIQIACELRKLANRSAV